MKAEVKIGYYEVKFYNHKEKKVMYFNGKQFESFPGDPIINDEIESYLPLSYGNR